MARADKVKRVERLVSLFEQANAILLSDFRGLNVDEITALRRNLKEAAAEYRVAKNRLTKIALKQAGCANIDDLLTGPTAIAVSHQEPVLAAKALYNFAAENEKLKLKGGLVEGKRIDAEAIKQLAMIAPRPELLAQLVRGLSSPLMKVLYAWRAPATNLCFALRALADKQAQQ